MGEVNKEVSVFLGLLKQSNSLVSEDFDIYEDYFQDSTSPQSTQHCNQAQVKQRSFTKQQTQNTRGQNTNLSVIYSASESEAQLSAPVTLRNDRFIEESFEIIARDLERPLRDRLLALRNSVLEKQQLLNQQIGKLQECVQSQQESMEFLRQSLQVAHTEQQQLMELQQHQATQFSTLEREHERLQSVNQNLTLKNNQLKELILASNKQYELLESRQAQSLLQIQEKDKSLNELSLNLLAILSKASNQIESLSQGSPQLSQNYSSQAKTPLRERDSNITKPKQGEVLDRQ